MTQPNIGISPKREVDTVQDQSAGVIFATCGANGDPNGYQLVGRTVSYAMRVLRQELNFAEDAQPHVNGDPVGTEYILKDKDRLQFPKPPGALG